MKVLTKKTYVYRIDTEKEATDTVQQFKDEQYDKGYTVTKTKVDYKTKKDRKTGEIAEEWWIVEVTVAYEV